MCQDSINKGCAFLPAIANKRILPRHRLWRNNTLTPRDKTPSTRSKRLVENASVLDLGEVDDAIGLNLYFLGGCLRQQNISRLFGKRLCGKSVERACPVNFFLWRCLKLQWLISESALGDVICRCAVGGWCCDAGCLGRRG